MRKFGIVWLNPSAANDTYALAVRKAEAESEGLRTLEDLAAKLNAGKELTFGCNIEFYKRDDGLKPLQKAYGFAFPRADVKRMETGLVYKALKDGDVDVGLVFATDGRIPAFNFVVLKDTKNFFPAYAITPTIRKETLDAHPDLADDLNKLSGLFDDATHVGFERPSRCGEEVRQRSGANFFEIQRPSVAPYPTGRLWAPLPAL